MKLLRFVGKICGADIYIYSVLVGSLVVPENQFKMDKVLPAGRSRQHVHGITLHADLHLHVAHAAAWTPHNVSHSTLV